MAKFQYSNIRKRLPKFDKVAIIFAWCLLRLSYAPCPTQFSPETICKASVLRRHLAKGQGLKVEDFDLTKQRPQPASLREVAMLMNAPSSVHRILDEINEPPVPANSASRLCATAIDRGYFNSFVELHREYQKEVVGWLTVPPAIGAQKILYRYLEGTSTPAQTKKMVTFATELGVDWTVYEKKVHEHTRKYSGKFDQLVIEMQAHALERSSPQPASQSRRCRL